MIQELVSNKTSNIDGFGASLLVKVLKIFAQGLMCILPKNTTRMDAFSITTTLTKNDYTKFFYRETYKKPATIIAALAGVYLMLSSIINIRQAGTDNYLDFLEAVLGFFVLLVPTLAALTARRNAFSNPASGHPVTYTFSENSIHIKTFTTEVTATWQSYIKVKESSDFILLYNNKKLANFVKKDTLSAEQVAFIKSKVGKQK